MEVDDLQRRHLRAGHQDGERYVGHTLTFGLQVGTTGTVVVRLAQNGPPSVSGYPIVGDEFVLACPDPADPDVSRFRQDVLLDRDTVIFTLPVVCLPWSRARMSAGTSWTEGDGAWHTDSAVPGGRTYSRWFRYL